MDVEQKTFESWCIVEIMGHSRYAGLVTEQTIGGCSFVRVDVPEIPGDDGRETQPAFTKLFSQGSIFCITPCTEEAARTVARSFRARALSVFDLPAPARQLSFHDDEED